MAEARVVSMTYFADGIEGKKRLSQREKEALSTPSWEAQRIAEEEEHEAKKAEKTRKATRMRLAKDVLSAGEYDVFWRRLDGQGYHQIAKNLDTAINTIRNRYSVATKKLRQAAISTSIDKKRHQR